MRFLFLSLLASGLLDLPFGVAAPLSSTNPMSLKERNSKPCNSERDFSTLTSSTTVHAPSFRRCLPLPPSVVTSIVTSPINSTVTNKRRERPPTALSLSTIKRSKGTPRLTRTQQKGSAAEKRSSTLPGEEPRVWSGLRSRSADADTTDSCLMTRANAPDAAKDPDYNKNNGYWAPMEPVYYVLIGIGIVLGILLVNLLVRCLVGGKDTVEFLKTWQETIRKHWKERLREEGQRTKW